jgi:uncharacterized membrane protein
MQRKFWGNCHAVNESSYSALFRFPIAAYGLFFYLVIWWTILVADYAQGPCGLVAFILLFPLIVLALLVDLFLVLLLIELRQFFSLCAITYAINLSLLVVFLFWLKRRSVFQRCATLAISEFCNVTKRKQVHAGIHPV